MDASGKSLQCQPVAKYVPGSSKCRVMSVLVIEPRNDGNITVTLICADDALCVEGNCVVVSGNSDGRIEVLGFSSRNNKFIPLGLLMGFESAIRSAEHVKRIHHDAPKHIVVVGGTDGRILFWDITSLVTPYVLVATLSSILIMTQLHEL